MATLNDQVVSELKALREVGVRVPVKLIKRVALIDLSEYDNMLASEIADLLILLEG